MTVSTSLPEGAAAVEWQLSPLFLLRIGGLPVEVAESLASPRSTAWAEHTLELEQRLRAAGGAVADLLERAVAGNADDRTLRRDLLNVRRDVFNLRVPDTSAVDRLRAALQPPAGRALSAWLRLRQEHEDQLQAGRRIVADEIADRRAVLRALANDADLRCGILLASPSLDRYLPTYLDAAGTSLTKRARRIERSLLEYLYRATCKTSPFSTLTTVSLGEFRPGFPVLSLRGWEDEKIGRSRLNMAILARLSASILAQPALRTDLPVAMAAGWQVLGERVRYLRRRTRARDDHEDSAVSMDVVHESVFFLPAGQLMGEVLVALADGRARRLGELVDTLAAARADSTRADIERYLHHLLRIGLLVTPSLHLDIHRADPLSGFRAGLLALDRPWAAALADRLERIRARVCAYPSLDLAGRREALAAIRGELQGANADLGVPDAPVPRTVLYEDTTQRAAEAVGGDVWRRSILPDLERFAALLPIFDVNLPLRLATKGFFRARFGAAGCCDDVLRFAHEFQQDFFEHYSRRHLRRRAFDDDNAFVRQENWFKLPEIEALDDAREELARRIGAAYARLPAGATELGLDRNLIEDVAALVPRTPGRLDPRSFFLQVAELGEGLEPLAVVNRVYSGLTLLFSRFAHLFEDGRLERSLRETLVGLQPEGVVFAELKGGYDSSNLNLHPAVTPYELVCPGEVSGRPAAEQIPVDDLTIVDDVAADRVVLRSRRLNAEVVPVYLGFLMPMALPELQQVLLTFSYTGMAMLDLWAGTEVPLPDDTIASYPRIRHGNVVLQRRMWKAHPGYLPASRPGATEDETFLEWRRWRRDNGLPRRVFVTSDGAGARLDGEGGELDAGNARGEYKPLYVDFDSQFSVSLLAALVRQSGRRLVITEMLPDPNQLLVRNDTGSYVTELTIELTGMRRVE